MKYLLKILKPPIRNHPFLIILCLIVPFGPGTFIGTWSDILSGKDQKILRDGLADASDPFWPRGGSQEFKDRWKQ